MRCKGLTVNDKAKDVLNSFISELDTWVISGDKLLRGKNSRDVDAIEKVWTDFVEIGEHLWDINKKIDSDLADYWFIWGDESTKWGFNGQNWRKRLWYWYAYWQTTQELTEDWLSVQVPVKI